MASLRDRVKFLPITELDAMERDANRSIEDLRTTYHEVSRKSIDRIAEMIGDLAPRDDAWRTEVYRLAHDLKGQGATFGHDLVTQIAQGLCIIFQSTSVSHDANFAKRAIAHCEAMRLVLDKDIRGSGGERGRALLKILSIAT